MNNAKTAPVRHEEGLVTPWTKVINRIKEGDPGAPDALEELCNIYWQPIFRFIRAKGVSHHVAEELTQEFIAGWLRNKVFYRLDRSRGKFRSYLYCSLRRLLNTYFSSGSSAAWHAETGALNLDEEYEEAPESDTNAQNAKLAYDRAWAKTVLSNALVQLAKEERGQKRSTLFKDLQQVLLNEKGLDSREELAQTHKMTVNALGVVIFRLRKRYKELVLLEIKRTLAPEEELEKELNHLLQAVGASNLLTEMDEDRLSPAPNAEVGRTS